MIAAAIESRVVEATRLALTFPADPYARTSWSGIPAGLLDGFVGCGVAVSGIGLQLPPVLHKTMIGTSALVRLRRPSRASPNAVHEALTRARVAPSQGRLESLLARRRVRGLPRSLAAGTRGASCSAGAGLRQRGRLLRDEWLGSRFDRGGLRRAALPGSYRR